MDRQAFLGMLPLAHAERAKGRALDTLERRVTA
jgi:hypothetical protein